jgi:hypothetical protein
MAINGQRPVPGQILLRERRVGISDKRRKHRRAKSVLVSRRHVNGNKYLPTRRVPGSAFNGSDLNFDTRPPDPPDASRLYVPNPVNSWKAVYEPFSEMPQTAKWIVLPAAP